MSTRTQRRRDHKRLKRRLDRIAPRGAGRPGDALAGWWREALRRAADLRAPPAWGLVDDPSVRATADALDPNGALELLDDLGRICAEAVGSQAGRPLDQGSRPLADRVRLRRTR